MTRQLLVSLAACILLACDDPAPTSDPSPPSSAAFQLSSSAKVSATTNSKPVSLRKTSAQLFETETHAPGLLPRGDAFALGFDGKVLDELVAEADKTKSDALIIVRKGHVVVERYFGKRPQMIETMSVTKSLVALAIGLLWDEGKIESLDVPLSKWLPSWKAGDKAKVSLRHVLTQSSGLKHHQGARVLNTKRDRFSYATHLDLATQPGQKFSYNNEATQLLSGVIRKAAGERVDTYLRRKLFQPLGIKHYQWDRDGAGNVQTYYGLSLHARDLVRIGLLLLKQGRWKGKQLLSERFVSTCMSPSKTNPYYGLLWWLRFKQVVWAPKPEAWQLLSPELRSELAPLRKKSFASQAAFWLEAGAHLKAPWRQQLANLREFKLLSRPEGKLGFYGDGWLGQWLVVYPQQQLVAVRQHRSRGGGEEENRTQGFRNIFKLLEKSVPSEERNDTPGGAQ